MFNCAMEIPVLPGSHTFESIIVKRVFIVGNTQNVTCIGLRFPFYCVKFPIEMNSLAKTVKENTPLEIGVKCI